MQEYFTEILVYSAGAVVTAELLIFGMRCKPQIRRGRSPVVELVVVFVLVALWPLLILAACLGRKK